MIYYLFVVVAILGIYFAFRYFSLIFALKKTTQQLTEISNQLEQNQSLKIVIPHKQLAELVVSCNSLIKNIQYERQGYIYREKNFKKQIENISHDLRTPLTVILGYLKIMKKKQNSIDELLENGAIIEQKAEVMKHLVTQFYDYSRFISGDYDMNLTQIDVGKLLRETLLGNYEILAERNLKVDVDMPNTPLFMIGDEIMLQRIFLNLLQNASRYAKSFLCICAREKDGVISLFFSNDTVDLKSDEVAHVFDRFYMKNESRNTEQTGLGLTIAKSLAESLNGTLTATTIQKTNPLQIQFVLTFGQSFK